MSDGVEVAVAGFEADDGGVIAAVNSAALKQTGYTAHELLGQHFHMLIPTRTPASQPEPSRKAQERRFRDEIQIERKDGRGAP